jgi:hypothetical protein
VICCIDGKIEVDALIHKGAHLMVGQKKHLNANSVPIVALALGVIPSLPPLFSIV